jgi:hypothetical protein
MKLKVLYIRALSSKFASKCPSIKDFYQNQVVGGRDALRLGIGPHRLPYSARFGWESPLNIGKITSFCAAAPSIAPPITGFCVRRTSTIRFGSLKLTQQHVQTPTAQRYPSR